MNLIKLGVRTLPPAIYILWLMLFDQFGTGLMQNPDPLFELPVQLVGFPVIVLSVRLSQFAKKLAYSLNPNTYRSRSKRDTAAYAAYEADLAHKEILREYGPRACILEDACRVHASRPGRQDGGAHTPWREILRNFRSNASEMKQWYLLSVFIGDAVRNVPLCKHLAKRLPCTGYEVTLGPLPAPQPR